MQNHEGEHAPLLQPQPQAASDPSAPELDEWALVDDDAEYDAEPLTQESGPTPSPPDHVPESATTEVKDDVPDGCLRIRLRTGEELRPAWFKATQVVDDFVAEFFADAVAEGKKIRLIYMGMLLIRDRSMGEYGIEEDGVIHCVITEAPPTPHPQAAQNGELKGFTDPTNALLIITGVFLYGLWTLLYHFPHLFSWKSIVLLSLFSAAHVSATVSRFMRA
uniref:Ubiquitin-like domain-containing protein n=1 Tax=Globisporangium ultimum (strain ATCC 200006 / CBS 805.95 / DAOM BR144) TaxID=431595 RepID=K3WQH0_GLOUD